MSILFIVDTTFMSKFQFFLKKGLTPFPLKEKEEVCGGTAEEAGSVGKMSSLSVNLLLLQSSVHSIQPLSLVMNLNCPDKIAAF